MVAKYTIGMAAFKRGFTDVIASVGPADGSTEWLQRAQRKAIEIHNARAFNPELAFDFDALIAQIEQVHKSAAQKARILNVINTEIEAQAARVPKPARRVEIKPVTDEEFEKAEAIADFEEAMAANGFGADAEVQPEPAPLASRGPEAETGRLVKMTARLLESRERPLGWIASQDWTKLTIAAAIGVALGILVSRFFR